MALIYLGNSRTFQLQRVQGVARVFMHVFVWLGKGVSPTPELGPGLKL